MLTILFVAGLVVAGLFCFYYAVGWAYDHGLLSDEDILFGDAEYA